MPTITEYERFFDTGGTNHFTGLTTGVSVPDHGTLESAVLSEQSIVPGILSISILATQKKVIFKFKDALSSGEQTTLTSVCAAHTGVPNEAPTIKTAEDGRQLVANHQIPIHTNPYWYSRGDDFSSGTRRNGSKCFAKLTAGTPTASIDVELIDPTWMLGGAVDIVQSALAASLEDDYITMKLISRATPMPTRRTSYDGNCNLASVLDAGGGIWQADVLDKDLTAPPGSPTSGDRYIVGNSATGDWSTHDNEVAEWNGSSWDFETPASGWHLHVTDEDKVYRFTTSWAENTLFSIIPAAGNGGYEVDLDANHVNANPAIGLLRVSKASPVPVADRENPDGFWDYDCKTAQFTTNSLQQGSYHLLTFPKELFYYVNEWRMPEYEFQSPSDTRLFLPHWYMNVFCNRDTSHGALENVLFHFGFLCGRIRTD